VAPFFLKARLTVEKTISVSFSDLPGNSHITKLQLLSHEAVFQLSVVRMQAQSFFLINAGLRPSLFEPGVLLAQAHIIAERVDGLSRQVVICGSMGYGPESHAHALMTNGEDPSGKFKLRRTYRPAYQDAPEPIEWTEWGEDGMLTRDYICISQLLSPVGFVVVPPVEEALRLQHSTPNSQWPSSHMQIGVAVDIRTAPQDL